MANTIGVQLPNSPQPDYSKIPPSVIEEASQLAAKMVGDGQDSAEDFLNEILNTYMLVAEKDVLLVFNPGGFGWAKIKDTPGWFSIIDGIREHLNKMGFKSQMVNYRRTGIGVSCCFREFGQGLVNYATKAKELAWRLQFLTDHQPKLKIIVTAESNGTVFSDRTVEKLKDNPRVFSIQTGTPFWHKSIESAKTLHVDDNGKGPDAFNRADMFGMAWATIRERFGFASPDENPGHVLSWLRAPGHYYSWDYPEIRRRITNFLEKTVLAKV